MQLIDALDAKSTDLRFMVRAIKTIKLFYVSTGRNAWWSTWITRYSPGCMHTTLDSAKKFCESRRVQGTIFYIDELPSLAFIAPERALIISEINTDVFLGRLDVERLKSITTVFPVSTITLQQMTYIFRPKSPLWPSSYLHEDSAILSFCSAPDTMAEISRTDELSSFASSSVGTSYYLTWSQRPFTKSCTSIHAIASALSMRLNGT